MSMVAPVISTKSAGGNIQVTAAVVANAAKGTIVQCNLEWNPAIGTQKEIIVPTAEVWLITDLYIAASADGGTSNPQVEFKKDNDRLLDTSNLLLSVLITSAQRPNGLHGNLQYEGGSHMSAQIRTSKANNANADAIVAIAPYEKSG